MLVLILAFMQAGDPAPDSAAIRSQARELQAQFEFFRMEHLPLSNTGDGKCEVRIGRFCYWYDPTEPPLPEEPQEIVEARANLLDQLEKLATYSPTDPWILAQRVRYTIEQGMPDSAVAIATCSTWWCRTLAAYALYHKGDVGAADSMFVQAQAQAPMGVRCTWNILGEALETPERILYSRLDCRQRDSANALIFWRATPAFSRPGNDVRAEWYSRQTLIRAFGEAITHHGQRGSSDYFELLLRYGAATSFARRPPKESAAAGPGPDTRRRGPWRGGRRGRHPAAAFTPVRGLTPRCDDIHHGGWSAGRGVGGDGVDSGAAGGPH
jgi:hypothetical protein